jgi:GGDEF domain-containing protein
MAVSPVCSATPVDRLVTIFSQQPALAAVPVVDGRRVQGVVTRHALFFHLGHRYGFSLWQNRPTAEFVVNVGQGFDSLPRTAPLGGAVGLVGSRPSSRTFDPIVVEDDDGLYHGLLAVDHLLAEINRLKVEYARQTNPLTGLPGAIPLAAIVGKRLRESSTLALGWADIDDFKPYNDRYGFDRGDKVLLLLAEVLADFYSGPGRFLAHIGGDDFAFVTTDVTGAEHTAFAAAQLFGNRAQHLYDPDDRAAGGIVSVDRQGRERQFRFASLSIGLVLWHGEVPIDYHRLVAVATEAKSAAKGSPGPSVITNKRRLEPNPGELR